MSESSVKQSLPNESDYVLGCGPGVAGSMAPPIAMCNGTPAATRITDLQQVTTVENWTMLRRACCAVVMTGIADWSIYQSEGGYAGWAVLAIFSLIFVFLGIGSRLEKSYLNFAIITALSIAAGRLVWQGSFAVVLYVCVLLVIWSMSMQSYGTGYRRFGCFVGMLIPRAVRELPGVLLSLFQSVLRCGGSQWLTLGVPAGVCAAFAFLFTMANPEVSQSLFRRLGDLGSIFWEWAGALRTTELVFCMVVGMISLGLLVPAVSSQLQFTKEPSVNYSAISVVRYRAGRNTLLAVNLLFAGYLIVELVSSWGRIFPTGFYYSGYAHQGAAWLTVALGLTTFVLGLLFKSDLEQTAQTAQLRRLAIVWVVLNWLLAFAAYHRLSVYVEFNGLTRMRLVGFLGITCVAVGLIWAIRKIDGRRTFGWMLRQQFSTMLVFVFAYSVLPIDWIAHQFNVNRILAGHPEPLVQFTEQTLSDEAWICMAQLTDVEDELVRDGVRAMLADRIRDNRIPHQIWQHFQGSRVVLRRKLEAQREKLEPFIRDTELQKLQVAALRDFAYQWY